MIACPCHRNVKQPFPLRKQLFPLFWSKTHLHKRFPGFLSRKLQRDSGTQLRIEHKLRDPQLILIPGKTESKNRILQPFCGMHRQDLHAVVLPACDRSLPLIELLLHAGVQDPEILIHRKRPVHRTRTGDSDQLLQIGGRFPPEREPSVDRRDPRLRDQPGKEGNQRFAPDLRMPAGEISDRFPDLRVGMFGRIFPQPPNQRPPAV